MPNETDNPKRAEGFIARWSRRKAATETPASTVDATVEATVDATVDAANASTVLNDSSPPTVAETRAQPEPTDEQMPPLDALDENSDYSGFMSPKVSEQLRRSALRKLFRSAVFNIRDGLDDYDDDFRNFAPLGDLITSDMKHQMEMAEKRKQREQEMRDGDSESDGDGDDGVNSDADGGDEVAGDGDVVGDDDGHGNVDGADNDSDSGSNNVKDGKDSNDSKNNKTKPTPSR